MYMKFNFDAHKCTKSSKKYEYDALSFKKYSNTV